MACGTCGDKTQQLYYDQPMIKEEPTMTKTEVLNLAAKISEMIPESITYMEFRQLIQIVNSFTPQPPPPPPPVKV